LLYFLAARLLFLALFPGSPPPVSCFISWQPASCFLLYFLAARLPKYFTPHFPASFLLYFLGTRLPQLLTRFVSCGKEAARIINKYSNWTNYGGPEYA
jgi:hypothetical protein